MPYTFVKDWFQKTFPYFDGGNYETDEDGFIVEKPVEKKEESTEAKPQEATETTPELSVVEGAA